MTGNTINVSRHWFEGLLEQTKKTEDLLRALDYGKMTSENMCFVSEAASLIGYCNSTKFILSETYSKLQ